MQRWCQAFNATQTSHAHAFNNVGRMATADPYWGLEIKARKLRRRMPDKSNFTVRQGLSRFMLACKVCVQPAGYNCTQLQTSDQLDAAHSSRIAIGSSFGCFPLLLPES